MRNETTSARHRPSVAFMPEGEHILRWFCDPEGKLWHFVHIHQFQQVRTHCPDFFREREPGGNYPVCKICLLATQCGSGNWRLRREKLVLLYGTVIYTTHPSLYWRPSRPQLIIAPDEIRVGFTKLLKQGSPQQRAHFFAMVNPAIAGPAMVVQVQKGRHASVTINSFTAENQYPVTLGDWYKPLRSSWIGMNSRSQITKRCWHR
jgi:hypothetical protein